MKYKTTKKAIMHNYSNVIEVGYCGMQSLLRNRTQEAYTSGRYRWNADLYNLGDIHPSTVIVTGYRPFGNIKPDHEVIKKYEEAASKTKSNDLLRKFVEDVITD